MLKSSNNVLKNVTNDVNEIINVNNTPIDELWWAIAGRGRSESCGKGEGIDYEAKAVMPNIYGQLSNRKRKSQTEIKRQTWPSDLNKFR